MRILLIALSLICACSAAAEVQVDVFLPYTGTVPEDTDNVRFHALGWLPALTDQLNVAMPIREDDALVYWQDLMRSNNGKQLLADMKRASESLGIAYSIGLTELPAVVFDKTYVVYGTTDVSTALELYKQKGGAGE